MDVSSSHCMDANLFEIHHHLLVILACPVHSNSGLAEDVFAVDKTESSVSMCLIPCHGEEKLGGFMLGWMTTETTGFALGCILTGVLLASVGMVWCLIFWWGGGVSRYSWLGSGSGGFW